MKIFIQALIFICLLIITVYQTPSLAQNETILPGLFLEPNFEHISLKDGLQENSVSAIFQDHLGFLWLGTQNGFVKFDGYSMAVYQPDSDDPNYLGQHRNSFTKVNN